MASVILSPGQALRDLAVRLWKPGVVSGRVRDEGGDVLVGVEVRALRREPMGGRYRFSNVASALTDDQGRYRFDKLSPGEYLVAGVASAITIPEAIVETYLPGPETRPPDLIAAVLKSGAPVPTPNVGTTLGPLGALEWRGPAGTISPATTPD